MAENFLNAEYFSPANIAKDFQTTLSGPIREIVGDIYAKVMEIIKSITDEPTSTPPAPSSTTPSSTVGGAASLGKTAIIVAIISGIVGTITNLDKSKPISCEILKPLLISAIIGGVSGYVIDVLKVDQKKQIAVGAVALILPGILTSMSSVDRLCASIIDRLSTKFGFSTTSTAAATTVAVGAVIIPSSLSALTAKLDELANVSVDKIDSNSAYDLLRNLGFNKVQSTGNLPVDVVESVVSWLSHQSQTGGSKADADAVKANGKLLSLLNKIVAAVNMHPELLNKAYVVRAERTATPLVPSLADNRIPLPMNYVSGKNPRREISGAIHDLARLKQKIAAPDATNPYGMFSQAGVGSTWNMKFPFHPALWSGMHGGFNQAGGDDTLLNIDQIVKSRDGEYGSALVSQMYANIVEFLTSLKIQLSDKSKTKIEDKLSKFKTAELELNNALEEAVTRVKILKNTDGRIDIDKADNEEERKKLVEIYSNIPKLIGTTNKLGSMLMEVFQSMLKAAMDSNKIAMVGTPLPPRSTGFLSGLF